MHSMFPVCFDLSNEEEEEFEVPWEDEYNKELQEEWDDGYELGYALGKLHAHADLIITMMENLIAAGVRYDKAADFMAMAFQVGTYNIESILPENFNRENPEKTKSY